MVSPESSRWSSGGRRRDSRADRRAIFSDADIVIGESFKAAALPKIEIFAVRRGSRSCTRRRLKMAHYIAIATDDPSIEAHVPLVLFSDSEWLTTLRIRGGKGHGHMKVYRLMILAAGTLACASGGAKQSPQTGTAPQTGPSQTIAVRPGETVSRAELRRTIDSMVNQPQFRSSHFGVLIVSREGGYAVLAQRGEALHARVEHEDRDGGNVLAQLGADYSIAPASRRQGT